MKIRINYDFFDKVRDAREAYGPLKIIRNEKNFWISFNLPIYTIIALFNLDTLPDLMVGTGFGVITVLLAQYLAGKFTNTDIFQLVAIKKLFQLVSKLRDLHVNTNLNLLLQSEVYEKKYQVKFNDKKLPYILESKYIKVPRIGFDGEVSDISILQEHVLASKTYEISIGEPEEAKKLTLAPSTN